MPQPSSKSESVLARELHFLPDLERASIGVGVAINGIRNNYFFVASKVVGFGNEVHPKYSIY